MLEAWVRLGEELGEIWKVFEVLEWSGIKRRKNVVFSGREGAKSWVLRLALALGMHTGEGGGSGQ